MADYSTIKGFDVGKLSNDPYASLVSAATWASGNNCHTTRAALSRTGTLPAGLITGGGPSPQKANTETYNGTTWT